MPKTFGVLLESELHAREGMGGKVCGIGLRIGEILLMDSVICIKPQIPRVISVKTAVEEEEL